MNEKELLELAAKAAGYDVVYEGGYLTFFRRDESGRHIWNPLRDDGDIARLEAALEIDVEWSENGVVARALIPEIIETRSYFAAFSLHGGDKNLARRYASTHAAAEIGRNMK